MSTNLKAKRWRTDRYDLQYKNPDGSPRSLAGCALYFAVKLNPEDTPVIAAALGAGVTATDIPAGKFSIVLPPIAKIGLSSLTSYYWDVLIVDATGATTTPEDLAGMLQLEETIANGVFPGAMATSMPNLAYHPEITALDGGGAAALDGYDTSTLSLPTLFIIFVGGQRQEWQARVRAAGEEPDDPQQVPPPERTTVLPLNWNAVSNNVIWQRVF